MEIPKFNSASFREVYRSEETKISQKISVLSQSNGVRCTTNPDGFVIDMNGFSNGGTKEPSANSRITLQRNLSRKGSQRGGDKMIATNSSPMDRDSSSPTVAVGASMAEKTAAAMAVAMAVGSQKDHLGVPQVHHQITITTGNTAAQVEQAILKRNSFRRPSSWFLDPKKVLLFFATVSCIGSMVLICFTLAIGKPNADDQGFH